MIVVTTFDKDRAPQVSLKCTSTADAAKAAVELSAKAPFTTIKDGDWILGFAHACPASPARLAHIIEYHALEVL